MIDDASLGALIFAELERQDARPQDLSAGDLTEVMVFAPFDLIALVAAVRGSLVIAPSSRSTCS